VEGDEGGQEYQVLGRFHYVFAVSKGEFLADLLKIEVTPISG
jgi:hypothetical protein